MADSRDGVFNFNITCCGTGYNRQNEYELISQIAGALASNRAADHCNIHFNGPGSSHDDHSPAPWYDKTRHPVKQKMAQVLDLATGFTMRKTIDEAFEKIKNKWIETIKNGSAKSKIKINLAGWSRGAATVIGLGNKLQQELKRALQEELGRDYYDFDIEVNEFLIDPVPGPGNHTDFYRDIPDIVNEVTVVYAQGESRFYLQPVDLNIHDPDHTKVNRIDVPGLHYTAVEHLYAPDPIEPRVIWNYLVKFFKKNGALLDDWGMYHRVVVNGKTNIMFFDPVSDHTLQDLISRFSFKDQEMKRGKIYVRGNPNNAYLTSHSLVEKCDPSPVLLPQHCLLKESNLVDVGVAVKLDAIWNRRVYKNNLEAFKANVIDIASIQLAERGPYTHFFKELTAFVKTEQCNYDTLGLFISEYVLHHEEMNHADKNVCHYLINRCDIESGRMNSEEAMLMQCNDEDQPKLSSYTNFIICAYNKKYEDQPFDSDERQRTNIEYVLRMMQKHGVSFDDIDEGSPIFMDICIYLNGCRTELLREITRYDNILNSEVEETDLLKNKKIIVAHIRKELGDEGAADCRRLISKLLSVNAYLDQPCPHLGAIKNREILAERRHPHIDHFFTLLKATTMLIGVVVTGGFAAIPLAMAYHKHGVGFFVGQSRGSVVTDKIARTVQPFRKMRTM